MDKAEARQWLTFAADDLESAEFLLRMPARELEIICYHAQQYAERPLRSPSNDCRRIISTSFISTVSIPRCPWMTWLERLAIWSRKAR